MTKKIKYKFYIEDIETGTLISTFPSEAEMRKALKEYEAEDIKDGYYTEDFYRAVIK